MVSQLKNESINLQLNHNGNYYYYYYYRLTRKVGQTYLEKLETMHYSKFLMNSIIFFTDNYNL